MTAPLVDDDGPMSAGGGERILQLLRLEPVGEDRFVAPTPGDGPQRLFGGQVASQALMAACHTVDRARRPHSFHAYFIRPGRQGLPLTLAVQRSRDGGSFSTRHVTASQDDTVIFELIASFHHDEPGDDWQQPVSLDVPAPDELAPLEASMFNNALTAFDIRPLRPPSFDDTTFVLHPFWIRLRAEIGDDSIAHACVLTYLSDIAVVGSARAPGSHASFMRSASLDHAVWIHRPPTADDWLLYSVAPTTNFGARGLARGTLHDQSGSLIASIAQEALLRPER